MAARMRSEHLRTLNAADLERRERAVQIRSAARKGSSPAKIAAHLHIPVEAVERVLTAVDNHYLSDPTHLIRTRKAAAGLAPEDVQLYWLGFLTAAGRIWGQGASLTLVITLGEKSQAHMETLMTDLTDPHVRYEFCRSSLLGWQLYIRDQDLCKALVPWGIPSDLFGEDPALLDDLPEEFAVPFLRGYVDGDFPADQPAAGRRDSRLALHGAPAVLAGIDAMVLRFWGITAGGVTPETPRAALHFGPRAGRVIRDRVNTYTARARWNGDTPAAAK